MTRSRLLALALLLAPATAAAQSASLAGAVYDSIAGRPLAGASVFLVGSQRHARTDAQGKFRLDSLPEGQHVVSFTHATLDSLGVAAPQRPVELRARRTADVALAVPAMRTLFDKICPGMTRVRNAGVVVGVVRDAETDEPLQNALVTIGWSLLNLTGQGLVEVPSQVRAVTNGSGAFGACGVPSDVPLGLQVTAGGYRTAEAEVRVRDHALARRDLSVTRTTASERTGSATLAGVVRTRTGRPLGEAQVMLSGSSAFTLSDSTGAFRLTGLPAGTQTIEARRLGFLPGRVTVDLLPGEQSRAEIELSDRAPLLGAVRVRGQPAGWDRTGFEERRRSGLGHFLDAEDIAKANAKQITEVLRRVPALQMVPTGPSSYAIVFNRSRVTDFSGKGCPAKIFLDGNPITLDDGNLDHVISPNDVQAIEAYAGASEAPAQYGGSTATCGVILLWTRNGRG